MMCGATRPTKLIMPTKDTASAEASVHMPMLTSVTVRVFTPRLEAVSAPFCSAL